MHYRLDSLQFTIEDISFGKLLHPLYLGHGHYAGGPYLLAIPSVQTANLTSIDPKQLSLSGTCTVSPVILHGKTKAGRCLSPLLPPPNLSMATAPLGTSPRR